MFRRKKSLITKKQDTFSAINSSGSDIENALNIESLPSDVLIPIFSYLDNDTLIGVTPCVSKTFKSLSTYTREHNQYAVERIMDAFFYNLYRQAIYPSQTLFKHMRDVVGVAKINKLKTGIKNILGQKEFRLGDFIYQEFLQIILNILRPPKNGNFYYYIAGLNAIEDETDGIISSFFPEEKSHHKAFESLEKRLDKSVVKLNEISMNINNEINLTIILLFLLQHRLTRIKKIKKNDIIIVNLKKAKNDILNTIGYDQIELYQSLFAEIQASLESISQRMERTIDNRDFSQQYYHGWAFNRRRKKITQSELVIFSTTFNELTESVNSLAGKHLSGVVPRNIVR